MFRKSIFIISFVAALGMGLTTPAKAADPDLVGYWNFDEGSGTTAFDSSGNGNDGIFVGAPQWVAGMYGGALEFDGDDYLDCGNDPSLEIRDEITIAFWFQVEAFQNSWEAFFSKGDGAYRVSRGGGSGDGTHMGISGTSASPSWFNGPTIITGGDWHHFAGTYDGTEGRIYIDGVLDVTYPSTGQINIETDPLWIANNSQNTSRQLHGLMDDVRLYSRALSEDEIQGIMAGGGASFPFAAGPSPEDGALVEATWVSMGWRAGDSAVSHDVYMSESFGDVNDGSEAAFQGSKPLTDEMQIVGFVTYPYPDGLVPGTTYYWRIDEVNDADPNSPWIGNVWSFTVPPKEAYNPAPLDAANYVAADAQLSWTGGFGAMLHTVYFGDDFDTVSNATGGALLGDMTFDPGLLEKDKTYYWRVDEFEAPITHKGDVWSFRTVPDIPITDPTLIGWWKFDEGAGTVALDQSGHDNHGELRGDPQWVEGQDGGALDFDGGGDFIFTGKSASDLGIEGANAKSVTAWVFTRSFNNGGIFDLGARSNGQNFCLRTLGGVNNWRTQYWGGDDHDFTLPSQNVWVHFALVYTGTQSTVYANGVSVSSEARTLATSAANPFQIAAYGWQANFFDGIIDDVRLYNKGLTAEEITVIMRGDTTLAGSPSPRNGALADVKSASPLTWLAGDNATQQDVYLATDRDAVDQADATDTTGVYRGRQAGTSFAPPEGLPWGTGPYFWRVDQVNTDGTIGTGRIWSFTVADFLIVDDMESYTDDDAAGEAIWQHWIDGFDNNANGSQAGNLLPPYAEQAIVHGGGQSLPLFYTNTAGVTNSEAELAVSLSNWTDEGVGELSIWFQGQAASTGSLAEAPVGTFTVTGSGSDIQGSADHFHFAYRTLTGTGSIVARVNSVVDTDNWAKAGLMIRETLEPGSKNVYVAATPGNGITFQWRTDTDAGTAWVAEGGITAPHWIKLERDLAGNFTATHSTNGTAWLPVGSFENVQMSGTAFVGLAVTSHNASATTEAVFSNVTVTGNVAGNWANQDIGIAANAAEPLYVAVSNTTGVPAVVAHPDPAAANIDTWTEWVIPLSAFSGKGINLNNVDKIALGLGSGSGVAGPGGSGVMYIDDISLYRPRP